MYTFMSMNDILLIYILIHINIQFIH